MKFDQWCVAFALTIFVLAEIGLPVWTALQRASTKRMVRRQAQDARSGKNQTGSGNNAKDAGENGNQPTDKPSGALSHLWHAFVEGLEKRIKRWGEKTPVEDAVKGDKKPSGEKSERPTRPSKPDLSGLSPADRNEAMKAWRIELEDYKGRLEEWEKKEKEEKEKRKGTWRRGVRIFAFFVALGLTILTIAIWGPLESAIVLGIINGVVIAEITAFNLEDWILAGVAYSFVAGMVQRVPPRDQVSTTASGRRWALVYVVPIAAVMGIVLPSLLIYIWLEGFYIDIDLTHLWIGSHSIFPAGINGAIAFTLGMIVCGVGMVHRHVHRHAWFATILVLLAVRVIQLGIFKYINTPSWQVGDLMNGFLLDTNGQLLVIVIVILGLGLAAWMALKAGKK